MTAVQPKDVGSRRAVPREKNKTGKEMPGNISHNQELERTGNVIKENNVRKTKKGITNFKKAKKNCLRTYN